MMTFFLAFSMVIVTVMVTTVAVIIVVLMATTAFTDWHNFFHLVRAIVMQHRETIIGTTNRIPFEDSQSFSDVTMLRVHWLTSFSFLFDKIDYSVQVVFRICRINCLSQHRAVVQVIRVCRRRWQSIRHFVTVKIIQIGIHGH